MKCTAKCRLEATDSFTDQYCRIKITSDNRRASLLFAKDNVRVFINIQPWRRTVIILLCRVVFLEHILMVNWSVDEITSDYTVIVPVDFAVSHAWIRFSTNARNLFSSFFVLFPAICTAATARPRALRHLLRLSELGRQTQPVGNVSRAAACSLNEAVLELKQTIEMVHSVQRCPRLAQLY